MDQVAHKQLINIFDAQSSLTQLRNKFQQTGSGGEILTSNQMKKKRKKFYIALNSE